MTTRRGDARSTGRKGIGKLAARLAIAAYAKSVPLVLKFGGSLVEQLGSRRLSRHSRRQNPRGFVLLRRHRLHGLS